METKFWCYIIIILILAIGAIILTIKIKEKYIILQSIDSDTLRVFKDTSPDSLKYRGHRYNRHRIRANPHTRTYYR